MGTYNGSDSIAAIYGRLYTWFTATDSRSICPDGLHIPSDQEWKELEMFLGMSNESADSIGYRGINYGIQLKANDNSWTGDIATNSSGFSALDAGFKFHTDFITGYAAFWNSTDTNNAFYALNRFLKQGFNGIVRDFMTKCEGLSIRCMKAVNAGIENINQFNDFQIYPNPANNKITIDCSNLHNSNLSINNIVGEFILQRQLGNGKNEIDISNLSKGIYIIKIESTQGIMQQKLIKE